ncbi:MAG TPA: hypothetical protein VGG71_15505, partial [Chitinophagaceae bacterium]
MKLLYKSLVLLFITAAFVNSADAQRGDRRGGGGGNHQSFSSSHPDNSSPRPNSFSLNRGDNRTSSNQPRQNFQSMTRSGGNSPSPGVRDRYNGNRNSNNAFVQRDQRIYQSNVSRVNSYRSSSVPRYGYGYKGSPYHYAPYHSPYYSYAPRPYVYVG